MAVRSTFSGAAALALIVCAAPMQAAAQVSPPVGVESVSLGEDAFSVGILKRSQGALKPNLWRGADPERVAFLLDALPGRPAMPAFGDLTRRVLLSPGQSPQGATRALSGAKLMALVRAGYGADAETIASLANTASGEPETAKARAFQNLLMGDEAGACARGENLASGRGAPFWLKMRLYCYVASQEQSAAYLTLGLLNDQSALDDTESAFFNALIAGTAPKTPPKPRNALEYAMAKRLGVEMTWDYLSDADMGVIATAAHDENTPIKTRILAGEAAVFAGAMTPDDLGKILRYQSFSVEQVSKALDTLKAKPNDPMTDSLVFEAASEMAAPEFIAQRTELMATLLRSADTFPRVYALSLTFAPLIKQIDAVRGTNGAAEPFALALMAAGEMTSASAWIATLLPGDQPASGALNEDGLLDMPQQDLGPSDAVAGLNLLNLLSLVDPQGAQALATFSGLQVSSEDPAARVRLPQESAPGGEDGKPAARDLGEITRVVDAALDAAADGSAGQAALSALAASAPDAPAEAADLRSVVTLQALRLAGLEDSIRRLAFETTWAANAPGAMAPAFEKEPGEEGVVPRRKPARR